MNKKALAVLEYDKIINMLRDCAGSEMAKARIAMFRPSSDPYKIKERLAETTEAVAVITAKGALPVGQLYDIENALHFARKGGSLTMKQLLQVLYNMKVTGEIVSFLRSDLPELSILDGMREVLVPFPRLADRIDRCGANACQARFNGFASPGKRIGNVDLFGMKLPVGKVRDGTNALHLCAGKHRLLHFEANGRVHGHDVQEVRTGTNERHE